MSPAIAAALQARLNAVTPRLVRVRVSVSEASGVSGVSYRVSSLGSYRGGSGGQDSVEEDIKTILRDVQAFMSEKTGRAWPSDAPAPSHPRFDEAESGDAHIDAVNRYLAAFPAPGVSVGEHDIRVWYGDETQPVLTLDPIPLSGQRSAWKPS